MNQFELISYNLDTLNLIVQIIQMFLYVFCLITQEFQTKIVEGVENKILPIQNYLLNIFGDIKNVLRHFRVLYKIFIHLLNLFILLIIFFIHPHKITYILLKFFL